MPYQFKLDFTPAGYALESATPGQVSTVAAREFTSSEDGELFISRLETHLLGSDKWSGLIEQRAAERTAAEPHPYTLGPEERFASNDPHGKESWLGRVCAQRLARFGLVLQGRSRPVCTYGCGTPSGTVRRGRDDRIIAAPSGCQYYSELGRFPTPYRRRNPAPRIRED